MDNTNNEWITLGLKAEKCILSGNIDLAKEYLLQSISLSPNRPWPYLLLASITDDNDEAIDLIRATKKIKLTEWYYINLIEKYTLEIEKLKEDFLTNYHPDNLKDESAILHWKQLQGFSELSKDITHDITIGDVLPIKNHLECICLLCTGQEYISDIYLNFLQHLEDTLDPDLASEIHFKLVVKTTDQNRYVIPKSLYSKFKTVSYIVIDIPEEIDIYDDKTINTISDSIKIQYGSKYGPNFVFFETMKKLHQYNTSILLECDCLLFEEWMNRIHRHVETQSFLISGSQTDSPNHETYNHLRNQHINGGTAMYATGHILFQKFIRLCEQLWPKYIKYINSDLPYDYIILLTIQNYFNISVSNFDHIIWAYIKKHYLYNSLVFNWSDTTYADYDPAVISSMCNPAILHQKPPKYPGLIY